MLRISIVLVIAYLFTLITPTPPTIDETIWTFEPDGFVPHNLQGEGPKGGAPVEIGTTPPVGNRKVLINLANHLPDFIRRFQQVFDFVPVEPVAKQAARERFKNYANWANITTQDIANAHCEQS